MKLPFLSFAFFQLVAITAAAQVVSIPDATFKACLVGNTQLNTNMDNEIQVSEATSFTGTINCVNIGINSLEGIQAFTSLTRLFCHFNNLTTLDVSQNVALTTLHCNHNQLTSIDVSQLPALREFRCQNNMISSLDVTNNPALIELTCQENGSITSLDLSQNPLLKNLDCRGNNLMGLDVSSNTELSSLSCGDNINLTTLDVSQNDNLESLWFSFFAAPGNVTQLSLNTNLEGLQVENAGLQSLDVSQNTGLEDLYCNGNQLTSLDVSQNVNLRDFSCSDNLLSALDVSPLDQLRDLHCSNNQLVSLDVSQAQYLERFYCSNNALTSLNMKTVNPEWLEEFDATSNPNLLCIEVDDVAIASAQLTNIDAVASFSLDCSSSSSTEKFIAEGRAICFPNPVETTLYRSANLNVQRMLVRDLNGRVMSEVHPDAVELDVTSLAAGVYFIEVQTLAGLYSQRFIKR